MTECFFSLNRPTGPIKSIGCNVHVFVCVCLSVHNLKWHFLMDLRPLVKVCIANIGLYKDKQSELFNIFFCVFQQTKKGFWVFANHTTEHSGELAGGWSVAVAIDVSEM